MDGSATKISDEILAKVYGATDHNSHYEIEMEDPMSPKFISSYAKRHEEDEAETKAKVPQAQEQGARKAPEIVLSAVGERPTDEDSDGGTPPSSEDEDDYPDQVTYQKILFIKYLINNFLFQYSYSDVSHFNALFFWRTY